ncbi:MAG: PAS domain-containing protein [Rhodospirillaceae bacterium]
MTRPTQRPTGVERVWAEDRLIVSKTDAKGIITYANSTFCEVAQYTEAELMGQPQNVVRHPDMPRCIFKLLWDTIQTGQELFAYMVNLAKTGDHYWVFAHVTPTFDQGMRIIGYHSSRRVPRREAVDAVVPLYRDLTAIEARAPSPKQGLEESTSALNAVLQAKGVAYDEFALSL